MRSSGASTPATAKTISETTIPTQSRRAGAENPSLATARESLGGQPPSVRRDGGVCESLALCACEQIVLPLGAISRWISGCGSMQSIVLDCGLPRIVDAPETDP
jgi:hypothetical protein